VQLGLTQLPRNQYQQLWLNCAPSQCRNSQLAPCKAKVQNPIHDARSKRESDQPLSQQTNQPTAPPAAPTTVRRWRGTGTLEMAAAELGFSRKGGRNGVGLPWCRRSGKQGRRRNRDCSVSTAGPLLPPPPRAPLLPLGGGGAVNGEAATVPTAWGFEPFWGDGRTAYPVDCGGINEPPSTSLVVDFFINCI